MTTDSDHIFTFGCQYLRGFSPDRSDWARDLAMVKSLHFNTIRVWLVWGVLEPADGVIDSDYIDTILSLAEANGLRVIFLFHLHGAPEWAISKYRDCWYVDQNGRPFEPSARANTPSGGWPGLCPDHPLTQQLEERFIAAVCQHVGSRAFAYEPINEPHVWIDMTQNPSGTFCFCDATRQAFRLWLQKRYGTLEALGHAWGHRFADWNDVRPPTWRFGYPDTVDWRTFATENIAALVERRTALIRRYAPGVPVIAHAWGGGTLTCTNLGGMAFDDWKNARCLDKWGCSAFPSRLSHACNIGLSMDGTRSAADGREFWQAELSAGDTNGGFNRTPHPSPEVFSIWCWEAIAHGSRGLLFWQFRKELYGNESGAYGLTDYDGQPTDRARAAAHIAQTLNDHAELFNHATLPTPQVAILFSYRSFMLNWAEQRHNSIASDAVSGYYRIFWEHNIPVDILHEEFTTAEKLAPYKLLILPAAFSLSPQFTDLLHDFTARGGSILADPLLAQWDEHQRLNPHTPGNGLHALFGCEENTIDSTIRGDFTLTRPGHQPDTLKNTPFRASWKNLAPQAVALAQFADGAPAIVDHPVGLGHAILSGINLGNMFSQQASISDDLHREYHDPTNQAAADIVIDIADRLGVTPVADAPAPLRVKHLVSDNRDLLIIFEYQQQPLTAELRFPQAASRPWQNLLNNEHGQFSDGTTTLSFSPNETKVLLLG